MFFSRGYSKGLFVILLIILSAGTAYAQATPALPSGLMEETPDNHTFPPALPTGLQPEKSPELPQGISEDESFNGKNIEAPKTARLPFDLTGFWELRAGRRLLQDSHEKSTPLGESRLQIEIEKQWTNVGFKLTSDFIYDTVVTRNRIRLNRGEGWLDLREANVYFTPTHFMDVRVGRQVLTWGTGDMIFINDLFPKGWNSYFIGRDPEYLKAPSDTVKVSLFSAFANLDIYYNPSFEPDRYIDGRRISYWNSYAGQRSGRNMIIRSRRPSEWFQDDEAGFRAFKNIRGYELAFYGYRGFWKSPAGKDPVSQTAIFPDLNVYGGSLRGRAFNGIGHIELGYYDSNDDRGGDDPFIMNSEIRFLIGYEEEVAKDFTIGAQYYLEHMRHYGSYRKNIIRLEHPRDRHRHLFTIRPTKLLFKQNLTLSLFTYFSPSDSDGCLRPRVTCKISDEWTVEAGGNIFWGRHDYTFWGQFEKNTNVFFSIRKYLNI